MPMPLMGRRAGGGGGGVDAPALWTAAPRARARETPMCEGIQNLYAGQNERERSFPPVTIAVACVNPLYIFHAF